MSEVWVCEVAAKLRNSRRNRELNHWTNLRSQISCTLSCFTTHFGPDQRPSSGDIIKKPPWSESGSELYLPSDRRLSAKWLPTFEDRGVPRGRLDGSQRPYSRFSRQEPILFYQVAPQLYSRGWVDPVPDPLLFFLVVSGIETGNPDL
jgi:hypothetical protein